MTAVVLFTFAAVFLTVMAVYLAGRLVLTSPAAKLKRRLRHIAEGENGRPPEETMGDLIRVDSPVERILFRLPLLGRVKRLVELAGVDLRPVRVIILIALACVALFIVVFALYRNIFVAVLCMAIPVALPLLYLDFRKKRQERLFTEQLPDVLTMIARSLRAGHSLSGSVELIGQEMAEPSAGFFRGAYEQQKLGIRIIDALTNMLKNVDSMDLRFFLTILKINADTGGNLAEILEKLAETIRSRLQIRRQVQVYTAEGRMSGYVLVVLPVALFVIFYLFRPGYVDVFFTERICQYILALAVLAEVAGFLVIRKIVNIRI